MPFDSQHFTIFKSLKLLSDSTQSPLCILISLHLFQLWFHLLLISSLLLLKCLKWRQRPLIQWVMQKNLQNCHKRIVMLSQHLHRLFTTATKDSFHATETKAVHKISSQTKWHSFRHREQTTLGDFVFLKRKREREKSN